MYSKKYRQGFTLIELLIVLLVLGFIMAVIIASITKSKNNGADLQVRETLSGIQVKLSENEVASGTVDYQSAFSSAKAVSKLSELATKVGVAEGDYRYIVNSDSYAIVFPLKKGGYYCVDYKQAKEINTLLNTTGTINCDNTIGSPEGGGTGGTPANVAPTANAGVDQTITLPTSSVNLSGSGTDADGSIVSYFWTKVSGTGGTITNSSAASTTVTGLTAGSYTFKLTVTDNSSAIGEDTLAITVNNQSVGNPYNGPHNIPGTIQSEDFDNGGEGVAYHDDDPNNATGLYRPSEGVDLEAVQNDSGGYNIGWIAVNEWQKYSVNVLSTANYTIKARIAGFGGSFRIEIDGTTIATINPQVTNGYQTWQDATVSNIPLTQGLHTMRVFTISSGYNLNYLTFSTGAANQSPTANAGVDQTITLPINATTLSGSGSDSDGSIASYAWTQVSGPNTATIGSAGSASTSVSNLVQGTYTFQLKVTDNNGATGTDTVVVTVNAQQAATVYPIPGTIQSEDYMNGGEGVGYHDLTTWNSGGASYRNDAVDIESTSDSSGTYDVAYIGDGEWLKYAVNVASTGNYTISLRGASANGDGYIRMKMDGQHVVSIVVPNTGGWQTWQTITVTGVPLTAGLHTMEVEMNVSQGGGMNLNYYTFSYEGVVSGPNPPLRTLKLRGPMAASGSPMHFYESLPKGYYDNATKTYPLLVFLHGAGETPPAPPTSLLTGAGVVNQINNGAQLEYTINGKTETFVVLAPQSDWWWNVNNVDKIIEYGKRNYKIDTTRIYLTGLSSGSGGTAKYFGYSPTYGDAFPRKLAAAALFDGMSGTPATEETSKDGSGTVPVNYCYAATTSLPLWIFNASGHWSAWTNSLISTLNACTPAVNLKVTNNNDADSYWKGYISDHTYYNPNVYEWLLQNKR